MTSQVAKRLKHPRGGHFSLALELFAVVVDAASLAVLVLLVILARKAIGGFKQSKQALSESASLIGVIVSALTSRIQQSESVVSDLRSDFEVLNRRNAEMDGEQASLRSVYLQLLRHLQEILSNDKRLILELEQLKTRVLSLQRKAPTPAMTAQRQGPGMAIGHGDILGSLTTTERETLEILVREGPKGAPELGRRLKKSREHTSRLMKKLYLEGYVDRESNHAPFRYKVNEVVGSALESPPKGVTAKASEMV